MTTEQQDNAWQSLPEGYKKEVRNDYADAKAAHELDPTDVRIDMHIIYLERYFGKHNLTATEEDKTFKVGDTVMVEAPLNEYLSKFNGTVAHIAKRGTRGDGVKGWLLKISSSYVFKDEWLIPYTEEQELKHKLTNGDKVVILSEPFVGIYGEVTNFVLDDGESFVQVATKIGEKLISPQNLELISPTVQNCEKTEENGDCGNVDCMPKEDAEELAKCLAAVDDFIKECKMQQVDWLSYRMELAKTIACSVYGESPKAIVDNVMQIVDGIVERLKGEKKQ